MTKAEKVERLAIWLNEVCVDWPPIGFDWHSRRESARRAEMRRLARVAIKVIDGAPINPKAD